MRFLNIIKLALVYYAASITSYLVMAFCAYFNLLYDSLNKDTITVDFYITMIVVGAFFAVFGALSKEKSIYQLITLWVCNIIACALHIVFEGSIIDYVLIAFDSVQTYAGQFFFYNVMDSDYFSYTSALLLSCLYPTIVFLVFKLMASFKKLKITKRLYNICLLCLRI